MIVLAILDRTTHQFMGLISIENGTIGYWLGEPFWGKGFMKEGKPDLAALQNAQGGPKITRSTPISMLFCTANSLNNPFQKDCALNRAWQADAMAPGPFGDFISFDGLTGEVKLARVASRPSEILQVVQGSLPPHKSDIYQRFERLLRVIACAFSRHHRRQLRAFLAKQVGRFLEHHRHDQALWLDTGTISPVM